MRKVKRRLIDFVHFGANVAELGQELSIWNDRYFCIILKGLGKIRRSSLLARGAVLRRLRREMSPKTKIGHISVTDSTATNANRDR